MDLYTELSTLSTIFSAQITAYFMETKRTDVLCRCHEKTFYGENGIKLSGGYRDKKDETSLADCCNGVTKYGIIDAQ